MSGNVNSFVLLTLGSGYWPTGYAIFNFLSLYVEPGIMRCKPFVIIMETHWEINEKPSKNSTKWKHSQCENDLKLFFFVNIFNLAKLLFYRQKAFSKILKIFQDIDENGIKTFIIYHIITYQSVPSYWRYWSKIWFKWKST